MYCIAYHSYGNQSTLPYGTSQHTTLRYPTAHAEYNILPAYNSTAYHKFTAYFSTATGIEEHSYTPPEYTIQQRAVCKVMYGPCGAGHCTYITAGRCITTTVKHKPLMHAPCHSALYTLTVVGHRIEQYT